MHHKYKTAGTGSSVYTSFLLQLHVGHLDSHDPPQIFADAELKMELGTVAAHVDVMSKHRYLPFLKGPLINLNKTYGFRYSEQMEFQTPGP